MSRPGSLPSPSCARCGSSEVTLYKRTETDVTPHGSLSKELWVCERCTGGREGNVARPDQSRRWFDKADKLLTIAADDNPSMPPTCNPSVLIAVAQVYADIGGHEARLEAAVIAHRMQKR